MTSKLREASMAMLALIALLIGCILLVVGFCAPYWFHSGQSYEGLWVNAECTDITEGYECHRWPIKTQVEVWFQVVRALLVAGLALMVFVLVFIPAYVHAGVGLHYRTVMVTLAITCFIGGICVVIGSVLYAFQRKSDGWSFSWCFFLSIVGGALGVISALILVVAACSKKPNVDAHYKKFPDLYIDPYKPTVYRVDVRD